jgi:hypothetical protein
VSDTPDLDERFTLHPMEGEEALSELLRAGDECEDQGEAEEAAQEAAEGDPGPSGP